MPPGEAIYAAAKAGLIAFTHAAFAELRDRGIKLLGDNSGAHRYHPDSAEQTSRPNTDVAARGSRRCSDDDCQRAAARLPGRDGTGAAARSDARCQLPDRTHPRTLHDTIADLPREVSYRHPESTSARRSFTLRFAIALVAGLAAAVIISPFAASAVAAMGFRFPFPRIFDRTVMVTLLAALLIWSRSMSFAALIRAGFARAARESLALVVRPRHRAGRHRDAVRSRACEWCWRLSRIGALAARASSVRPACDRRSALSRRASFAPFCLAGCAAISSPRAALTVSSAIYAVAHLVRSPKHYYLTGFHAGAGLPNLTASAAQLGHPLAAAPPLIGLFPARAGPRRGLSDDRDRLVLGWHARGLRAGRENLDANWLMAARRSRDGSQVPARCR